MTVSLKRYWVSFGLFYAVATLLLGVVTYVFDLKLGSGGNMAMLFAAGYGSSMKFVTDNKRAPDAAEKRKLALGSLAICWLISCLAIVVPVLVLGGEGSRALIDLFDKLPAIAWIVIVLVVSLIYYFVLSLIYGWAARKHAEKVFPGKDRA